MRSGKRRSDCEYLATAMGSKEGKEWRVQMAVVRKGDVYSRGGCGRGVAVEEAVEEGAEGLDWGGVIEEPD